MSLAIALATRGRPQRLLDTIARTLPMMARDDTRLIVCIDADDSETRAMIFDAFSDDRVIIDIREREDSLGAKWNRCLEYDADVYSQQGDYTPYATRGFDQRILDAAASFGDGIGVVYSNLANWSFPSNQSVTKKFVKKHGTFYQTMFPYWFVDHWLQDIAFMIDRVAYADTTVLMPIDKPATQNLRELEWWANFYDIMRIVRRKQAAQIIDDPEFDEKPWRKALLKRNFRLWEQRSQNINDHVRSSLVPNIGEPAEAGGERYDRLRRFAHGVLVREAPAMEKELAVG